MKFKWRGMSEDGETVILRKFSGQFISPDYASQEWIKNHQELVKTGVVVDVETTGLDKSVDTVIEIGLRRFLFNNQNGHILKIEEAYSQLQDPGKPLSKEISNLTGLTDEVLRGKIIDWRLVERALLDVEVIIAHNAAFDRPFIEQHVKSSVGKLWACSLRQIDWNQKGFFSHKLEGLSICHGFFIDSHRALNDAEALLHLLSMGDECTTYLYELLQAARRPFSKIIASGSPFESKDLLRTRGYRWDTLNRVWRKVLFQDQVPEEVLWLESKVYCGRFLGKIEEIPIEDNFK